jgi:DNA-binding NarL/FixJ family response regulator
MSLITIGIVDNNPTHIEKITNGLQLLKTCKVIGGFTSALEFLLFCNSSKLLPQVALLEVDMPIVDGVLLTDYLQLYYPTIKVIVVSNYCHKEVVYDMFSCGALGFVYKLFANTVNMQATSQPTTPQHPYLSLHQAIEAAYHHHKYIDPMLLLISKQDYSLIYIDHLLAKRMQQRNFFAQLGLSAQKHKLPFCMPAPRLPKKQ